MRACHLASSEPLTKLSTPSVGTVVMAGDPLSVLLAMAPLELPPPVPLPKALWSEPRASSWFDAGWAMGA